jgi:hypothetical protein
MVYYVTTFACCDSWSRAPKNHGEVNTPTSHFSDIGSPKPKLQLLGACVEAQQLVPEKSFHALSVRVIHFTHESSQLSWKNL